MKRPLATAVLAGLAGILASASVQANPDVQRLRTRAMAATCAHCHGTEGKAVEGEATIRLAGLNKDYMYKQLLAFRTGERPATIMHQITKGYSQEQLEEVSTYFSKLK